MRIATLHLILVFSSLLACGPKFHPPAATAPHAVIDLQIQYHLESDASLSQTVRVDGQEVPTEVGRRVERAPIRTTVRVAPGLRRWHVTAELSRTDVSQQRQSTPVRGGLGCPNGMPACEEARIQDRDQWSTEYVVEARCGATLTHEAQVGARYRLQFDFYGSDRCTLKLVP